MKDRSSIGVKIKSRLLVYIENKLWINNTFKCLKVLFYTVSLQNILNPHFRGVKLNYFQVFNFMFDPTQKC